MVSLQGGDPDWQSFPVTRDVLSGISTSEWVQVSRGARISDSFAGWLGPLGIFMVRSGNRNNAFEERSFENADL